jgi:SSS family solute:Na+ symporter
MGFAGATIGLIMAAAMYFVGATGFIIEPLRRAGVRRYRNFFKNGLG